LPEDAGVKLEIVGIDGRRVRTLLDRELTAGEWTVHWDGTNDVGVRVSSGVYFLRIDAAGESASRKLHVVR